MSSPTTPQGVDTNRAPLHPFFTAELDVWDQILIHAGLVSVLRMRKTCRYFADLTRHRVLWIKLLRQFCATNHIPTVTYDPLQMQQGQMEMILSKYYEFQRSLRGVNNCSITQKVTFLPLPPTERGIPFLTAPSVNTHKVVPGGRYIVGTGPRARSLCCWDLSGTVLSRDRSKVPTLLSSIGDPGWGKVCRVLMQCSSKVGNELIVAAFITTDRSAPQDEFIVIFSLGLDPSSAETFGFKQIRLIRTSGVHIPELSWTLDGNFVAVANTRGEVVVWNWENGMVGATCLTRKELDSPGATIAEPESERIWMENSPLITIIGPHLLAVSCSYVGLACHFLEFPRLYDTLETAREHSEHQQFARVVLSHRFIAGTFTRSWVPLSSPPQGCPQDLAPSAHLALWDNSRKGRGASIQIVKRGGSSPQRLRSSRVKLSLELGEYITFPPSPIVEVSPWGQMLWMGESDSEAFLQVQVFHDQNSGELSTLPAAKLGEIDCSTLLRTGVTFIDYWGGAAGVLEMCRDRLCLRKFTVATERTLDTDASL